MATEVLPDNPRLRFARRARAFAEMDAHDLDVMVLGRSSNVRYLSGTPQLWHAGTRPFGPSCIVVRETQQIFLMSTWDEGIPEEIPHENLFGISWNPMNVMNWLKGLEGVAAARRVGTDSLSPLFAQLLPTVFEGADIVDAESAMRAARRIKTPDEIDAIRLSLAVAEGALSVAVTELTPGIRPRELTAIFMEAMAARGVTTPSRQDVVTVTSGDARRAMRSEEPVRTGDLVAFAAGVVNGGYTGEVVRTWPVGTNGSTDQHVELARRWSDLSARLLDSCRPGATGADLFAVYENAGVTIPTVPIACGLGLGLDLPVVVRDLASSSSAERLEPGVVLALTTVVGTDTASIVGQDVVVITDDGADVLSTSPHWSHS